MGDTTKLFVVVLLGYAIGITVAPFVPAARNASGTYSLPVSNPVAGTTITASNETSFRNDVATEITDSLSRSGEGAMLAPLELVNGSVGTPALSFDSDTDCGLYRIGTNNVGMSVAGTKMVDFSATTTTFSATSNGNGVTATGNGNGYGGYFVGGATSTGVYGQAGGGNNDGVVGVGAGSGGGGYFSSAAGPGVTAVGNSTTAPLLVTAQSATPSATTEGQVYYDSDVDTLEVYASGQWAGMAWLRGSLTQDIGSIAAGDCGEVGSITLTGAATASNCVATLPADGAGITGYQVSCYVSSADTVVMRFCCNDGASACDPASKTYYFAVLNP